MKVDPHDPRLTAYALGELDEAEQAAIERELLRSDAAREAVEDIRETAEVLRKELVKESGFVLSETQRLAVHQKMLSMGRKGIRSSPRNLYVAAALLAAASLFLVVYPWPARKGSLENAFDTYQNGRIVGRGSAPPAAGQTPHPGSDPNTKGDRQARETVARGKTAPTLQMENRISGVVKDTTGSVIAGAEVILRPAGTRAETRLTTDASGEFQAKNLPPGPVSVTVSSQGFKTFSQQLNLKAKDELHLQSKLEIGQIVQTVMVNAIAAPATPSLASPKPALVHRLTDLAAQGLTSLSERKARSGGIGGSVYNRLQKFAALNKRSEPEGHDSEQSKTLGDKGRYRQDFNTEAYDRVVDNPFLRAIQNPLSTFSIDVDTAAYANLRRFLSSGALPPKDAVRIEEMVNYFSYDYALPKNKEPFSAQVEVAQAPWKPEHRLVKVGLKGREIAQGKRPPSNLVFLIDVSGSMQPPNRLPLIKRSLPLLVEKLTENDRVAIVVYAGASGLVLPSTACDQKARVLAALESLEAGGSTNGGSGIQLAYDTAIANFIRGGTNRVILATDGDFNVGVTNQGELTRLIEEKARSGVFLSVLGFGMGNYKDSTLEKLADKGNGNYAYVDSLQEARKVLVEQMGGTLITIAKDVKIQVEFNPTLVGAYRLIGYENRMLRAEDFNDDTKDAGEIGAGHTVTALYEVVPAGKEGVVPGVDALKYQKPVQPAPESRSGELLTVKLRYKEPDGETSKLLQFPVSDRGTPWTQASRDFKFAAAVTALGMILRDSPYKGHATVSSVLELATEGKGEDKQGYRAEFIELARTARGLLEGRKITD
ncbi:MAG: von Willebrand factor type A domain-containing protein [Acidobacteria bacterium]|nr:von Willebrand factor type A domain-containing protein [Acidobacteriota bacterium]